MVNIETVVYVVMFLIGAGFIFGLLWFALNFVQSKVSNPGMGIFFDAARVVLVLGAVFVLIGMILDFMGHPLIAWRRP